MSRNISPPARARPKRPLTLQMLVAQTEWLDGRILWQDGHIVWEHARGQLRPGVTDLSAAQRCLNQSQRYPQGNGDKVLWLEARWKRLKLAKRCRTLVAPDLLVLTSASRARNPVAVRRLVELLIAEAVCLNELSVRPSNALLSHTHLAPAALRELIHDESTPAAGRALAAMTLGALQRLSDAAVQFAPKLSLPAASSHFAWLRRSYEWGCRRGLPAEPALTVAFLAQEHGVQLAQHCQQDLQSFQLASFPAQRVRELLTDAVPPYQVVQVVHESLAIESIAEDVMQFYRTLLEQPLPLEGRKKARQRYVALKNAKNPGRKWQDEQRRVDQTRQHELVQSRTESLATFSGLLSAYVQQTRDANTVYKCASGLPAMHTLDFTTPAFKSRAAFQRLIAPRYRPRLVFLFWLLAALMISEGSKKPPESQTAQST